MLRFERVSGEFATFSTSSDRPSGGHLPLKGKAFGALPRQCSNPTNPNFLVCRRMPVSGFFYPARQRYRKVTIWALVQGASGVKVVREVPAVTPVSTAQRTEPA